MVSLSNQWGALKEAIAAYTGLSPAAFFTALAAAFALYYIVSGFFQAPPRPRRGREAEEELETPPPPVQVGEITEVELRAYDGSDPQKPLLMAIKGQIYDVSRSRVFYGPGGPYALFAGRDASRALAKMSFDEKDLTGDISGLGPFELDALQDWEYQFMGKYVKVGTVKKTVATTDESACDTSEQRETAAPSTEAGPEDHLDKQATKPSEVDISADHVAETKEPSSLSHHGEEAKVVDSSDK